jgi:hypothetical protein
MTQVGRRREKRIYVAVALLGVIVSAAYSFFTAKDDWCGHGSSPSAREMFACQAGPHLDLVDAGERFAVGVAITAFAILVLWLVHWIIPAEDGR